MVPLPGRLEERRFLQHHACHVCGVPVCPLSRDLLEVLESGVAQTGQRDDGGDVLRTPEELGREVVNAPGDRAPRVERDDHGSAG